MKKLLTRAHRHWRLRSATALAAVGATTVSLGIVLLGATTAQVNADEPCVPRDAWTETIPHAAVTHTEQRMTDPGQPYVAAVAEVWANWAPSETQGPQDYTPIWPTDERGKWNVHSEGIPPGHEGPDGVYQQGEGNSPWFYRHAGSPGQPYIAPSYTTVTVTDQAAWTEKIEHPAVVCDVTELAPDVIFTDATCDTLGEEAWDGTLEAFLDYEATGDVGPGETVVVEAMIEPAYTDEYEFAEGAQTAFTHEFADITLEDCVQGEETVIPKPDKPQPKPDKAPVVKGVQVVAPPAAAPTAVAAGLGGDTGLSTGQLGQGLAGLGLVILLAAGWLGVPRRVRGVHES